MIIMTLIVIKKTPETTMKKKKKKMPSSSVKFGADPSPARLLCHHLMRCYLFLSLSLSLSSELFSAFLCLRALSHTREFAVCVSLVFYKRNTLLILGPYETLLFAPLILLYRHVWLFFFFFLTSGIRACQVSWLKN